MRWHGWLPKDIHGYPIAKDIHGYPIAKDNDEYPIAKDNNGCRCQERWRFLIPSAAASLLHFH
jgi:hypothetical protein